MKSDILIDRVELLGTLKYGKARKYILDVAEKNGASRRNSTEIWLHLSGLVFSEVYMDISKGNSNTERGGEGE